MGSSPVLHQMFFLQDSDYKLLLSNTLCPLCSKRICSVNWHGSVNDVICNLSYKCIVYFNSLFQHKTDGTSERKALHSSLFTLILYFNTKRMEHRTKSFAFIQFLIKLKTCQQENITCQSFLCYNFVRNNDICSWSKYSRLSIPDGTNIDTTPTLAVSIYLVQQ